MTSKKPPDPPKLEGDDEDIVLWQDFAKDVKPIKRTIKPAAPVKKPHKAEKTWLDEAPPLALGEPEPRAKPAPAKPGNSGLDRKTDERLRRGQLRIDARIDLHGMTRGQAQTALERFILSAYHSGHRCVLVITGKGLQKARAGKKAEMPEWMNDHEPGVLKRAVPEWLAARPLAGIVLKTHPARPQHGGDGALYVLLRRQRRDR